MIRRLLSGGRVNLARRMLGRPYSIEGSVIEGRRLGAEKLSYPTANLKPRKCVIPANGVYITLTMIDGEWRRSVTNVGTRPTVGGDPEVVVETHLIDFNRNIYGETIRVRFLHRLRAERKFDSLEALGRQIGADRTRAVRYFENMVIKDNIDFR
jgi:riboflavin kinase/FMN adenylyltransferase